MKIAENIVFRLRRGKIVAFPNGYELTVKGKVGDVGVINPRSNWQSASSRNAGSTIAFFAKKSGRAAGERKNL